MAKIPLARLFPEDCRRPPMVYELVNRVRLVPTQSGARTSRPIGVDIPSRLIGDPGDRLDASIGYPRVSGCTRNRHGRGDVLEG